MTLRLRERLFSTPLPSSPLLLLPPFFFTDRYYARRTLPFLGLQLEFISRGMQSFLDFFTVEGFAETTLPRKSLIFLVSADEGKRREVLCRGFVSSSSFGVFFFFSFLLFYEFFIAPGIS